MLIEGTILGFTPMMNPLIHLTIDYQLNCHVWLVKKNIKTKEKKGKIALKEKKGRCRLNNVHQNISCLAASSNSEVSWQSLIKHRL